MNATLLRALVIGAAISVAPAAFAAGLDGMEYQKQETVKLKSGKVVTVMVGRMNGKKMAVIPMEDLHDLFERAEGHSMATDD